MARGYPDFEGGKVNLQTIAEWAAKEGVDKNFYAVGANKARGFGASVTYRVPAGKALYITHFSFSNYAFVAADSDNNSIGYAYITDLALPDYQVGGNGGGSMVLPKPFVIAAGADFIGVVRNQANHNCNTEITVGGYEVDV